jgi:hypothetical protein
MTVPIKDIATMEHVSVEKDSLVLIVQFILAQMIVFLVEHALTTLVFALRVGPISIAQLNFAPVIVVDTDIAKMDHVFAIPISMELTAQHQCALETATTTEFAWMVHAGVNLDLEEVIVVLKLAQMTVVMLVGAIMEHVFATLNMLELIVKSIKKMFIFQSNVLWTVSMVAWENAHTFILMMELDHLDNAMSNVHVNACLLVLDQTPQLMELFQWHKELLQKLFRKKVFVNERKSCFAFDIL